MFGSQGSWYYEHVAGIRLPRDGSGRGWRRILLDPSVLRPRSTTSSPSPLPVCALRNDSPFKLTAARAKSATPLGPAAIAWSCNGLGNGLSVNVTVPVGATAQLYLPIAFGSRVAESGHVMFDANWKLKPTIAGVVSGTKALDEEAYVFELLSGSYLFTVAHEFY